MTASSGAPEEVTAVVWALLDRIDELLALLAATRDGEQA